MIPSFTTLNKFTNQSGGWGGDRFVEEPIVEHRRLSDIEIKKQILGFVYGRGDLLCSCSVSY